MRILHTVAACILFISLAVIMSESAYGGQLDTVITTTGSSSALTDGSYYTGNDYTLGDTITISADTPISSVYIIWDSPVSEWTLDYTPASPNSGTTSANPQTNTLVCGQNGFLHEFVPLPSDSYSVTMNIKNDARICGIYAFSSGELPDFVQTWNTPCEEAEILVFSTHADDEILFLGGVLATYGGEKELSVQVCYMTNYWNGQHVREHEKLDGLWESGIRYYPVNGDFDDIYSETLEEALSTYDFDSVVSYVTRQIRTFKPNVVVTQDLNGEYGHGAHMLLSNAVCTAVDNSMEETFLPDMALELGTWDVQKTYLHLYSENQIWLNLNVPLDRLGGRTAIEVAKDAYLKHDSQQWCWFYVSDTYQYSCAKFGLYRSTVGADSVTGYESGSSDSGADMLENVVTHEEAARIAKEEAAKETTKISDDKSYDSSSETTTPAAAGISESSTVGNPDGTAFIVLAAMIILLILMSSFAVMYNQKRKRKKR